ncbi:MAG: permease-like cell division protein FtsX [Propionibacteriaceae bacterium]|jgi:cell division transport system permease protein|nr:permease-like cell division protein FtsX [Propionibacteriaceae bacterium]
MRHILRETLSGLKANASMTVAVVVTMWVSLSLFGLGLLAAEQVELIKGRWYDQIEISVFMCVPDSSAPTCTPGEGTTDAQRAIIKQALEENPEVESVYYEDKAQTYQDFKEVYKDNPIINEMTEDMMQDSYRIKLKNPEEYLGVVSELSGLQGVESVQDLRKYLDPLFAWLNLARVGTIGLSVLLLVAAALQIGNTLRLAAFARRREIGIMRLVGASNWFIMLPFLLEALIAAVGGALLACGSLAALEYFVIKGRAAVQLTSVRWIDWPAVSVSMLWIVLVGVVLSVLPTIIATRRFLKV